MGNKSSRISFYGSKCVEHNGKKYFMFTHEGKKKSVATTITIQSYAVDGDMLQNILRVSKLISHVSNYYLKTEKLCVVDGRLVQINDGFLNIWESNVHIDIEIEKHRQLVLDFLQFLVE